MRWFELTSEYLIILEEATQMLNEREAAKIRILSDNRG